MSSLSAGRALKMGLLQALSLWPAALLLFLVSAVEVFAGFLIPLGIGAWLFGADQALVPALGAWFAVWLGAQVLRVLVQGGAVRQGGRLWKGEPPGALSAQALAASPRSLSYLCWMVPIDLLALGWRWVALLAAGWAYGRAFAEGEGGFFAAGSLAAALVLGLFLGLVTGTWKRAALVRAIHHDQGVLGSLYDAACALCVRLWPHLLLVVVFGLIALVGEATFSSMASLVIRPVPGELPPLMLGLAGQLVAGLLGSFVSAIVELAALQGFLALALDERHELPAA
ncbi:MAG: hypothetical protein ACOZIN_04785, partial [Myxococcota bacterium]